MSLLLMGAVFGEGGLINGPRPTRDQIKEQLKGLKPASEVFSAEDVRFFAENADLIPDDYAAVLVAMGDATSAGKRTTMQRYAIGAVVGLATGIAAALAYKHFA